MDSEEDSKQSREAKRPLKVNVHTPTAQLNNRLRLEVLGQARASAALQRHSASPGQNQTLNPPPAAPLSVAMTILQYCSHV